MGPLGPRAAAHAPRRYRLRPDRGAHHLWRDRRQGVGVSRRLHARWPLARRGFCRAAPARSPRPARHRTCRSCARSARARGHTRRTCRGGLLTRRCVRTWRGFWRDPPARRCATCHRRDHRLRRTHATVRANASTAPSAYAAKAADPASATKDRGALMLQPKRMKHRKMMKRTHGGLGGVALRGNTIAFGDYAIRTLEPAWITARQIEAARRTLP